MIELHEIEELIKTVNRGAIKALLRNAEILRDPKATPEMKQLAEANVKAISQNKSIPKPKTQKPPKEKPVKVKTVPATQMVKPVVNAAPAPAKVAQQPGQHNVKLKYSPVYKHYGVTKDMWNKVDPDTHHKLFSHHNEVMAGKHPNLMHIKSAVEQQSKKVMKSLDSLHDFFLKLKKHL